MDAAIREGHYAAKQIFCKDRLVAWSHRRRFDVGVQLIERGGALAGNLEYDASRVPDDLADALRERLLDLLRRVAERPETALARMLGLTGSA